MTKHVLVTISGLHLSQEKEDTAVEVTVPGMYYEKNGKKYVLYEEIEQESRQATKNTLRFSEECMELVKKGITNVHMIFERQKKNAASYVTPYGTLLLGIDSKEIWLREEDDCIEIEIAYALEMNEQFLSDSKLHICIRPDTLKIDKE